MKILLLFGLFLLPINILQSTACNKHHSPHPHHSQMKNSMDQPKDPLESDLNADYYSRSTEPPFNYQQQHSQVPSLDSYLENNGQNKNTYSPMNNNNYNQPLFPNYDQNVQNRHGPHSNYNYPDPFSIPGTGPYSCDFEAVKAAFRRATNYILPEPLGGGQRVIGKYTYYDSLQPVGYVSVTNIDDDCPKITWSLDGVVIQTATAISSALMPSYSYGMSSVMQKTLQG